MRRPHASVANVVLFLFVVLFIGLSAASVDQRIPVGAFVFGGCAVVTLAITVRKQLRGDQKEKGSRGRRTEISDRRLTPTQIHGDAEAEARKV